MTARSLGASICFLLVALAFSYSSTRAQGWWIIPVEIVGGLALAGLAIWQAKSRQTHIHSS